MGKNASNVRKLLPYSADGECTKDKMKQAGWCGKSINSKVS